MRYVWLSLPLFACTGSDGKLTVNNSEPTATITSHADGAELLEAVEYTFIGIVSDDNHPTLDLLVKWSSDSRDLCPETTPDADGTTSCRITLEPSDTQLKLQVVDPEGAAVVTSINMTVLETDAPRIELLSPTADGSYYSDQLIHFSAIISDVEDDPSDLSYVWASSIDGDLPLSAAAATDGTISGYLNLSEGQHAISLRVEDSTGKSSVADLAITVGGQNNPPLCELYTPEAGSGYVLGQNIEFTGTANDVDIDNSLLNITWESNIDGVFDTTAANSAGELTLVYDGLTVGNHIVTLKVEDEVGGICSDTVSLTVGTAPTLSINSPLSGDVVSLGESVTFSGTVSDQEDIASDIGLSWSSDIDGEFSTQGSDSNGNIIFGYNGLSAGEHNIIVTATDTDGLTATTALLFRVNTPPPAPTLSLSPDPLYSGDTLSVSTVSSTDVDGDTVSYTFEWYENSTLTAYNTATIPASALDVDDTWMVRVTPNDGYTDGDSTEASITVSNTAPEITDVLLSPSSGIYNDSTITCSATATDADETVTATYEWTVGSSTYTGASLDLSTTAAMPTDTITCTASVSDSNGGSDTASSSSNVENRPPNVSNMAIAPSTASINSTLTCSATIDDDDGETPSYSVDWSVGGTSIGSGDSITLDTSIVSVGDTVLCTISASDDYSGSTNNSTSVLVSNTAPVVSGTSIDLTTVYNDDILVCSASVTDPDETLSISYGWTLGGIFVGGTDTLDLSTTSAMPTDTVECTATATDSDGASDSETATATVENRAPSAPVVGITPSEPSVGQDDLSCNLDTASVDPDGSGVSYTYEWSVNGTVNTSYTSDTIPASDTIAGEEWICTVTPSDGTLEGSSGSASVTITSACYLGNTCDDDLDLGNGIGMDFVLIPGGTFIMGSPSNELGRDSDEEQHEVTLTQDFYALSTEVTQGMFYQVMGIESYDGYTASTGVGDNYPAYKINWYMAASFANTLTEYDNTQNGTERTNCYTCSGSGSGVTCSTNLNPYTCTGYRLLTEAEWEYAARAGTTAAFWTANGGGDLPNGYVSNTQILTDGYDLTQYAWYEPTENTPYGSKEVASLEPNDWGLYDMSGNIWEVVHDGYSSSRSAGSDPYFESGSRMIAKGGVWNANPVNLRSAERLNIAIYDRDSSLGFRVGRSNITKPSAPDVSIDPSSSSGSDDLVCTIDTESVDPDGGLISYTFEWTLNGSSYGGTTNSTTYTDDTIPASQTVSGELWECTVTPSDGTEDGDSGSASITISSPVSLIDCTHTSTGYYCQGCVDVGNDGSACKTSSWGNGICGSCRLNACLHSPNYSSGYNQSCN
ncbi:MAG: SUMF1/EgtB/PvdO family nonheme iron enzyme [Myxococcota bacterium]|nr:SUMF1/EgtB/PvdO family nonheme iron enzyme [Myxococcota bacterium]